MTNSKTHLPKIALAQMCSSDNVAENLQVATSYIQTAATEGANLIVLPENFAFMGFKNRDRFAHAEAEGQGKIQDAIANAAAKHNIWIVAGSLALKTPDPEKVTATCFVYDNYGQQKARYDKIHLFDATVSTTESHHESAVIQAGRNITLVDTPIGKLGLGICFDIRFPEQFCQYYQQGVNIFALPSAFTVPTGIAHWHVLMRARAIDTFSFVLAAAQGGTHITGRKTYGHSLAVSPWGSIIAEKNDDVPGVIYADINLSEVEQARTAIPL